jgi:predicted dehydrogenase
VAGSHESGYKRVETPDGSWYDDPNMCPVAPILRLGIYGINDLLCIFGQPDTVHIAQSRLFTGRPTPDLAQLTLRFKNGAIGTSMAGWCLQPPRAEHCLTLHFENGTIYRTPVLVPDPPGHFTLCVVPADSRNGVPAESVTLPMEQLSSSYQWKTFHNAILGRPINNPTPDEIIVNGVRVIEAMKRSAASGRTERV